MSVHPLKVALKTKICKKVFLTNQFPTCLSERTSGFCSCYRDNTLNNSWIWIIKPNGYGRRFQIFRTSVEWSHRAMETEPELLLSEGVNMPFYGLPSSLGGVRWRKMQNTLAWMDSILSANQLVATSNQVQLLWCAMQVTEAHWKCLITGEEQSLFQTRRRTLLKCSSS